MSSTPIEIKPPTVRKLMAHPKWRHRPGTAATDSFGRSVRFIGPRVGWLDEDGEGVATDWNLSLDLSDAGTAGALLSMLSESGVAHQDWYCGPCVKGYYVWLSCRCTPFDTDDDGSVIGATLGEAVALALLAVWSDE